MSAFDDPRVKEYLARFEKEVLPNIGNSKISMCLVSEGTPDAKMCLEVGASVLLDKPILVVCINKAKISRTMFKIATEIVMVHEQQTEEDTEKIKKAIQRIMLEQS